MERWDIYDENKQPTGRTMARNDWHMQPGEFHITVQGVIKTPDGKYLITKRSDTKAWAAGCWEVSGGGVQAGETSATAVQREILEETGIDVSGAKGGFQFDYKRINPDEGDNYFVDIYKFVVDVDPQQVTLREGETESFRLATKEEIADLGAKGIFLHYDSIKSVFEDEGE